MTTTAQLANGTVLSISSGSPTEYSVIGNVKSFQIMTGANPTVEVTNLASVAKEFLNGLPDNGVVSFEVDTDFGDAGQAKALAAKESRIVCDFKVVLPGGTTPTITMRGYVQKFDLQGGVDAAAKSTVEIRVTGPVARA